MTKETSWQRTTRLKFTLIKVNMWYILKVNTSLYLSIISVFFCSWLCSLWLIFVVCAFQQERLDIEEKYSSLQEEVAGKTKKLKKVWTMYMQAKSEVGVCLLKQKLSGSRRWHDITISSVWNTIHHLFVVTFIAVCIVYTFSNHLFFLLSLGTSFFLS